MHILYSMQRSKTDFLYTLFHSQPCPLQVTVSVHSLIHSCAWGLRQLCGFSYYVKGCFSLNYFHAVEALSNDYVNFHNRQHHCLI